MSAEGSASHVLCREPHGYQLASARGHNRSCTVNPPAWAFDVATAFAGGRRHVRLEGPLTLSPSPPPLPLPCRIFSVWQAGKMRTRLPKANRDFDRRASARLGSLEEMSKLHDPEQARMALEVERNR